MPFECFEIPVRDSPNVMVLDTKGDVNIDRELSTAAWILNRNAEALRKRNYAEKSCR